MAVCIGAVVCGAMFGDNLSMISDTTIAAVKTQGCEMKDKFRENFKIVLPAALLTVVIFWVVTRNGSFQMTEELPYHVAQVIPLSGGPGGRADRDQCVCGPGDRNGAVSGDRRGNRKPGCRGNVYRSRRRCDGNV